jgi:hypothetical protein
MEFQSPTNVRLDKSCHDPSFTRSIINAWLHIEDAREAYWQLLYGEEIDEYEDEIRSFTNIQDVNYWEWCLYQPCDEQDYVLINHPNYRPFEDEAIVIDMDECNKNAASKVMNEPRCIQNILTKLDHNTLILPITKKWVDTVQNRRKMLIIDWTGKGGMVSIWPLHIQLLKWYFMIKTIQISERKTLAFFLLFFQVQKELKEEFTAYMKSRNQRKNDEAYEIIQSMAWKDLENATDALHTIILSMYEDTLLIKPVDKLAKKQKNFNKYWKNWTKYLWAFTNEASEQGIDIPWMLLKKNNHVHELTTREANVLWEIGHKFDEIIGVKESDFENIWCQRLIFHHLQKATRLYDGVTIEKYKDELRNLKDISNMLAYKLCKLIRGKPNILPEFILLWNKLKDLLFKMQATLHPFEFDWGSSDNEDRVMCRLPL